MHQRGPEQLRARRTLIRGAPPHLEGVDGPLAGHLVLLAVGAVDGGGNALGQAKLGGWGG